MCPLYKSKIILLQVIPEKLLLHPSIRDPSIRDVFALTHILVMFVEYLVTLVTIAVCRIH